MNLTPNQLLDLWRHSVVRSVRHDPQGFLAQQMAVLLTVYLPPPPHTVRGLAAELNILKPAITRALDRLGEFGLFRRKPDETDRRSIEVLRTVKGSVYLSEFSKMIIRSAGEALEE